MMLSKIQKIRSIGNYEDYQATGDVALKKFNFFYAENGAGKTTLASMLRSLSLGDGSIIEKHRRLNCANPPLVEIKLEDNSLCRYDVNHWNKTLPEIEVFDSYFVTDNVYSGMEITTDNRRALYKFVVGDTGVEISKKINRAKLLVESLQKEKSLLRADIINLVHYNDVEKIVSLTQKENIDDLIISKNQELVVANNNEVISKHEDLPIIKSIDLPFDVIFLKEVLQRGVENISEQYLQKVSSHIATLKNNGLLGAERWLLDGLDEIKKSKDGSCPFCGQSLENVKATIEGYNQYFSKEYNQLIADINTCNELFSKIDIDRFIRILQELYGTLLTHYNFWHIYLKDIPKVPAFSDSRINAVHTDFETVVNVLCEKTSNPLRKMETKAVDSLKNHFVAIISYINELQKYVTDLQPLVSKLRSSLRPVDVVNKELRALEIYKKRYESPLKERCQQYLILSHQIERLQHIVTQLQNNQKANSEVFLHQYGDSINDYLQNIFCTDFKIDNIKDGGYRGRSRDASLSYLLTFKGKALKLDTDDNLSFKNTLSEGDKNTIAFSLFLAKLSKYTDAELANKIVVFDDPLTSLDLNRRNSTITELVKLYQKCNQVIVLSHNLAFLLELYNRKKIRSQEKKVFSIDKQIDKSFIKEYQLRDELSTEFADCIRKIEKFQSTCSEEDKEPAINSIRLSLEAFLKFKYGRYLPTLDGTFGQIIAELEKNTSCVFIDSSKRKVIEDLNELNEISWRAHHASVDELGTYNEVDVTKDELHRKYVPMTLNLLFGRL